MVTSHHVSTGGTSGLQIAGRMYSKPWKTNCNVEVHKLGKKFIMTETNKKYYPQRKQGHWHKETNHANGKGIR